MSSKLWLPPSAGIVRYTCTTCGEEGVDDAHVMRCAREHADEIQERSLARKVPEVFDHGPERSDVELIEWVEENCDAILEGRKRVS